MELIRDTQQPQLLNVLMFKTEEEFEDYQEKELAKEERTMSTINKALDAETLHSEGLRFEEGDDDDVLS